MSKIINISEAATIAIHSIGIISSSKGQINVNEIAALTKVSRNHLAKVLQVLVKNNYLDSSRGPKGGFILKKPADEISLLEIYELIEGAIDNQQCGIQLGKCPFKTCVFGDLIGKYTIAFREYLRNKKISEIEINHHHEKNNNKN